MHGGCNLPLWASPMALCTCSCMHPSMHPCIHALAHGCSCVNHRRTACLPACLPARTHTGLRLLSVCASDADGVVARLALLSLLAVFKDLLPGYRIRGVSGEEAQVRGGGGWCSSAARYPRKHTLLRAATHTPNKNPSSLLPPFKTKTHTIHCSDEGQQGGSSPA